MTRVKRIALWSAVTVVVAVAGIWGYAVTSVVTDFRNLLVCSHGAIPIIPKALCQSYLFNFGGKPDDIADLNRDSGVEWAINAKDETDRKKLLSFLIKKGVDINAIDRSGLSSLHAATLMNDLPKVELLLNNGASPLVKDQNSGMNSLELALDRQGKPGEPDRSAIIRLLKTASG